MTHEPDLPRRAAGHFDLAWRELTRGRNAVHADSFMRVITGEPHPLGNLVIVNDASSLDAVEAAVRPLVDAAVPAAVVFTDDLPSPAEQLLVGLGFALSRSLPAMAVDIAALPANHLPPGCEFLRVGPDDAAEFTAVLTAGFDLPVGLARRFSPETLGVDPSPAATLQYFGVRESGRLVATSQLFLADDLAGVYSVAVLPDVRGRGIGAFATAEALRTAAPLGYRVGVLQSSQSGYPVYRRLGFSDVRQMSMFVRVPG